MSKTLVTGGTGLVGAHLLYHLTKSGKSPIALKRKTSNIQNVKKIFNYYSTNGTDLFNQIIWKNCDILNVVLLEDIIKKVKIIYHCAALVSFNNVFKKEMIEVNTVGTSNIIDLSLKHNIDHICHVSSIATLGENGGLPVDENTHWSWENKSSYAISKYLAEMELWRGFSEGLNGFIVNPSLIIGPGFWNSGIGTIIKKSKISGPFYTPGSCGVIDVNDLTKIMILLMDKKITNERFIINSDHISYKKLMTIISTALNKTQPSIQLSPIIIKILIYIDIIWNKVRGKKIELSLDAVKYTTNHFMLNSSKIDKTISHNYVKISESIKQCIELFKKEQLRR